jgi:NADH-quinone oxidoreductase subunit I
MPSVTSPDDAAPAPSSDDALPEADPSAFRRRGLGRGLVSGLATTARALVRPSHTAEYPDVKPDLPPRSRGVIALQHENCTSCMLCARECPDWCIYIESHKEEVPATEPGGRARSKNMLDRFAIDFSLCMYCGICIEVCPFDALYWSPEFEYAEFDIRNLLHESERLQGWMASVPPPPLADPRAPEPKEVGVARTAADKAIAAYETMLTEQPAGDDDENPDHDG